MSKLVDYNQWIVNKLNEINKQLQINHAMLVGLNRDNIERRKDELHMKYPKGFIAIVDGKMYSATMTTTVEPFANSSYWEEIKILDIQGLETAEAFDTSTEYTKGDLMLIDGKLYECCTRTYSEPADGNPCWCRPIVEGKKS